MRPPDLLRAALAFTGMLDFRHALPALFRHASGRLSDDEKSFIPEIGAAEGGRRGALACGDLCRDGRRCALYTWSFLPLMLIGLPRLYGSWHMVLTGLLQHVGLADNVLDHRLNSRTVYMNPISRFIYWNMNYHVEHHMFPMVPYHALPQAA